jgi:hypothetical protein
MNLEQALLIYPGNSAEPGVCHLVIARDAPDGAAVLIGNPEDNPSTAPTNALERIAALIANRLFGGQLTFRLYQYEPEGVPTLAPTFYAIQWHGQHAGSMPTWDPVDPATDPFLSEAASLVRREPYTLKTLAGLPVIDATEPAGVVGELRTAASGRA